MGASSTGLVVCSFPCILQCICTMCASTIWCTHHMCIRVFLSRTWGFTVSLWRMPLCLWHMPLCLWHVGKFAWELPIRIRAVHCGGVSRITPVVTVGVCSPRYHQSQTWFTQAVSSDFRMRARLVDRSSVLTLAVQLLLCTLTRACVFRLLLPCMFHRGHA